MEIQIDKLISILQDLKQKQKWNDSATIYFGEKNGLGVNGVYLCAEETYKSVNIPLFKIGGDSEIKVYENEVLEHDKQVVDRKKERR